MCGRYYRQSDKQRIAEAFHAEVAFELAPSYNVAPGSFQPVIRLNREGRRTSMLMRWGLIPSWAKDPKIAFSTLNARSEAIATTPAFREAFRWRRCLIPADGFFEWQKLAPKNRQPYAIALRSGEPFAFAGLWESWTDPANGEHLLTYTVATTETNELMAPIHNRMPVILRPADYARWLEPGDPARPPVDLLRPYDADEMTCWKVGKEVGNVQNNGPELIARQGDARQDELRLFAE